MPVSLMRKSWYVIRHGIFRELDMFCHLDLRLLDLWRDGEIPN